MLTALIDWSLRNRFIVVVGTLGFVILGALSLQRLNIDAFPDTTPVQVQINTIAPGLGPLEVESQITFPVEQGISGLPALQQVRSRSQFGLSQVVVTFTDGTDIYFARQLLTERLGSVILPEGMPRPTLGPVATGLGEVFHYLVTSDQRDLMELRTLQEWVIRPALRTVPGTAEINSWGGEERQYQVEIDPERLLKYNLTFDQLVQAVRDNNLNVGGGSLNRAGQMTLIQGVGRTNTIDQIRNIPVAAREGTPILVRHVADVRTVPALRMGGVTAMGRGEVVLGLGFTIMNENGHEVTERLSKKLAQVKKNLPPDVRVIPVYQRTELVDQVIHTVRKNLFEGGLLVIAVLFIFLGNLRAGLIVALAIPLSMLFAFAGMLRFGIAASLLSLGALDFGLLVDSSVIMVENVMRRLGAGSLGARSVSEGPTSRMDIIRDAAVEVRQPTMFGELIIMIVYLPILTLEGVEGKLFRPMALTVIFALVGSLVLSLMLMPVLASLLLPHRPKEQEPWLVHAAREFYAPLLKLALSCRWAVIIMVVGLLGMAGMMAWRLGSEFIPRLSEGALVLTVFRLPGTDLEESLRSNTRMEKAVLAAFPDEVQYVWARCGTAEVATDPMGPEESDFFITLKPRYLWKKARTQDELTGLITKEFAVLPGQRLLYSQPIEQRVNEMTSGVRSDVAVKLFGDDFNVLTAKAQELQKVLESIEGAADVNVEQLSGQPMLQIRVLQDQIARYGIPARSILELVESLGGKPVGEVLEAEGEGLFGRMPAAEDQKSEVGDQKSEIRSQKSEVRDQKGEAEDRRSHHSNSESGFGDESRQGQLRFPLAIRLPPRLRSSPEKIGSLLVAAPSGERLPLSHLASIKEVPGPAKIMREAQQRRIVVQCNIRGRDLGSFVAEAQQRVAENVKLPSGRYRLEWGGQFENLQRARVRLWVVGLVALALIFALLYLTYERVGDVFIIFSGVPFAWVGGILALWLRGLPFSISAGVGFVALSGVAVLNSMVLVTFIRHLHEAGLPLHQAVKEAALTRLRPVLMTALVASLGFVPMAISTGVGAEVQRPLATVVIGGVISSTVLTLLVLPVIYDLLEPLLETSWPFLQSLASRRRSPQPS